ncbi:MAG: CO dehydrogenase/CO-methylating acetyl-CoA synthase complex subunit beta [Nitrososphaerota archaeon]|uniref:CO dehydrogenase/CO-methylating acetyl-CoA synthase complex subunit beta n=1 Tax=Candidatus Bathycorpusculum sp. TaxID=2994959 RepID=UPI00282C4F5E|nr:CO dehydrogenase/CO-methylating acetyl-CoA synthase complex subunit beta [Candidatus Termiticorpusculum sp.]MCL2256860.1 CO dehydrogenase/CO-methylating acetyl-CoA synthase complex subunit beta [Candidatus Termiticorpusculum sp.]MCL2293015.1 CO dehydrogenase/CO-methylating acetyl-CoA synthase complex subunit beta [Candidatus Termiticorpusculum sp.]MDR0459878.1 CO dehydrogenase/CO-methylating acetyl-CoA synthase complex subunit beta [Nitrososphaerota archaeon]
MFKDIPVEVGVIFEGERIRRNDMQVELGGPKVDQKFEIAKVKPMDQIEDGKVVIVGPDLKDLKEGGEYPLGILIEAAGAQLDPGLEGVIERRLHGYLNYIEGFMHLNQRYDIQIRLGKKSFQKGLNTFEIIGKVLYRLFKNELPIIEKLQITFITDISKIGSLYTDALASYEARDAKARGLKDNEVPEFYGCVLCQSFAPSHVCVITPQRYSNCGAISWHDGKASASIDPKGPIFAIPRGDVINEEKGEFSGVNEAAKKRSMGEVTKVWLYTAFDHPHTSCGCFEAVTFYIPEVDGFGIVHRTFKGVTVNGLPFSTLADSTAGGRQIDGFHGMSLEYMRSSKFFAADGGWNRVVWVPKEVKEKVKDFIPKDIIGKIATEDDAKGIDDLKTFLKEKNHPIVAKWTTEEAPATEAETEATPVMTASTLPISAGGFKIILTDAKIYASKVVIKKDESKTEKR